jgi:DNA-binding transcriptional regulator YhcF (GntR family)
MGEYMNYDFTDEVRWVLTHARQEAVDLRHDYVGTEHILLALLRQGTGEAATVLQAEGVKAEEVRQKLLESVRAGRATAALGQLPYTSRGKKVLEYAMAAARELNHSYVGTEHLLLGLIREEKGIAAQVLLIFDLTYNEVLARVMDPHKPKKAQPRRTGFRIQVDDSSEHSIYEQIIAQVQEGVATGVLQPGDRLPTVRQLADELDIAPGTVARAYSELERLAVVVTEGARGTRIAERKRRMVETPDKPETLAGLLRPVAVAAFHLGATAADLRTALERAMLGIFDPPTAENR